MDDKSTLKKVTDSVTATLTDAAHAVEKVAANLAAALAPPKPVKKSKPKKKAKPAAKKVMKKKPAAKKPAKKSKGSKKKAKR
jgi:hypothetical protein